MANIQARRFLGSIGGDNFTRQKAKAAQIAKEQQAAITEKLRRNGLDFPRFEFLEYIGKGAYGLVYKVKDIMHGRIAAIKVIEVETEDFKQKFKHRDATMKDILHEIRVLQQLQDAKAKNINPFLEAFQIHSQLWIVSEYCPGGSLSTLLRGNGGKFQEKYILPIARELAVGLHAIHEAGIIHRDLKCANVMVHEKGYLRIIDFGVSGVLQSSQDKRSTVIGTAHWMPPELLKNAPPGGLQYGTEVDIWSYGCCLFEMAMGHPPFHHVQQGRMIGINQTREPPRLKKTEYSDGLCDLVAYVLQASPVKRPSMEQVLQDGYIKDTQDTHPTASLLDLVDRYVQYEQAGGQRQSLWNPGGAQQAAFPDDLDEGDEEWNFSTTANFDHQFAQKYPRDHTPLDLGPGEHDSFDSYQVEPELYTSLASAGLGSHTDNPYNETQTAHLTDPEMENRVRRGGKALANLFDTDLAPYTYGEAEAAKEKELGHYEAHHRPTAGRAKSDLPLRNETQSSSLSTKELHVDGSKGKGGIPNIDLANVGTIKANRMNRVTGGSSSNDEDESDNYGGFKDPKRATMGWTFGNAGMTPGIKEESNNTKRATKEWAFPTSLDTDDSDTENTPIFREPKRDTRAFVFPQMQAPEDVLPAIPKRPPLAHSVTAPVGEPLRAESGIIDIDALMMTDPAPQEERDHIRAALTDDDPTIRAPDPSQFDGAAPSHAEPISDSAFDENPPTSASSTDDEGEYTLDPLAWKPMTDEELKAGIEEQLNAEGILDPLTRGIKRRERLKHRQQAQSYLQHDLQEAANRGREQLDEEDEEHVANLSHFPGKDHALFNKYAPQTTPSLAWPHDYQFGQKAPNPALTDIAQTTNNAENISPGHPRLPTRDLEAEVRALGFPDPIPPNPASLAQDAPDQLLIDEATRLLRDMMKGLEVGKGVVRRIRESMEAENGISSEKGFGGYDGADERMDESLGESPVVGSERNGWGEGSDAEGESE